MAVEQFLFFFFLFLNKEAADETRRSFVSFLHFRRIHPFLSAISFPVSFIYIYIFFVSFHRQIPWRNAVEVRSVSLRSTGSTIFFFNIEKTFNRRCRRYQRRQGASLESLASPKLPHPFHDIPKGRRRPRNDAKKTKHKRNDKQRNKTRHFFFNVQTFQSR